jgi:hypothetical protein
MYKGVINPIPAVTLDKAWQKGLNFAKYCHKNYALSKTVPTCDLQGVPIKPEVNIFLERNGKRSLPPFFQC